MNKIKFCAKFFQKKKNGCYRECEHFTKLIVRIPIYRSRGYPVSVPCDNRQYITDEPNKPEQKHPLHAASYNHENMISRDKQLVDTIRPINRIPRQSAIVFGGT